MVVLVIVAMLIAVRPQEAKLRNPDIVLYGLPWGEPGWINEQQGYYNGNDSITYQINWLQCARDTHNLTVDWLVRVPVWSRRRALLVRLKMRVGFAVDWCRLSGRRTE